MKDIGEKVNWDLVPDRDLPSKPVSSKLPKKHKNYLYIPSTSKLAEVIDLGKNCLAAYALLTTAQAMHPLEQWHTLPVHQLLDTGLDRFQIYRAMAKLEAAGLMKSQSRPGRKTRYRLIP